MAIKLENTSTGAIAHCIGLWTSKAPSPRVIYAFETLQGHHALDEGMVEFDEVREFVIDEYRQIWRRLRPVKPWRIVPRT